MSVVHILPNLRKGLSRKIESGLKDKDGLRAGFNVKVDISGHAPGTEEEKYTVISGENSASLSRSFYLVGPVDIRSISPDAFSQVVPEDKSSGFSNGYMPYIEFHEEDFPWRYTPLVSSEKLNPWLLLLACKEGEYTISSDSAGNKRVRVDISSSSGEEKDSFYPRQENFHRLAHVQITTPGNEDPVEFIKDNPNDGVSRLFCSRILACQTKYTMFLVPAFELGRLAGLGEEFKGKASLEKLSFEGNPSVQTFPIYHQWTFTTGAEKFMELAEKQDFISGAEFAALSSGLKADISETGLKRYRTLKPVVDDSVPIDIPAALVKKGFDENKLVEENKKMDEELKNDLLLKSPVFSGEGGSLSVEEDPWVVPPVYGARHIMAKPTDLDNSGSFLGDLNLKFRNRAAAGMGSNVVKKNQEMFMNRAWGIVEHINSLNQRIREFYQVMKTNGAADEKTTELRYYKFVPQVMGLQTDAAIRIANAQSAVDINAVDMAADVNGNNLNVMYTSMGDYPLLSGISMDELSEVLTKDNWAQNKEAVVKRGEPYQFYAGWTDFFGNDRIDKKFRFLKKIFNVKSAGFTFLKEGNEIKIKANTDETGAIFSFHARESVGLQSFTSYLGISGSRYVLNWLQNTQKYSYKERHEPFSVEDLIGFFSNAQKEYNERWSDFNGTEVESFHSASLPVIVNVLESSDPIKVYGSGWILKQKAYDMLFSQYPEGVKFFARVPSSVSRPSTSSTATKKVSYYILPEKKFKEQIWTEYGTHYNVVYSNRSVSGSFLELERTEDGNSFRPKSEIKLKPYLLDGFVDVRKSYKSLISGLRYAAVEQVFMKWPSGASGKVAMGYKQSMAAKHYKGYSYFLFATSLCYELLYANGCLSLFVYWTQAASSPLAKIDFSSTSDVCWYDEGQGTMMVDLDLAYQRLVQVDVYLRWFDSIAWRPDMVTTDLQNLSGIHTFTADEIASVKSIDSVIKEVESIYDQALVQVDELNKVVQMEGISLTIGKAVNDFMNASNNEDDKASPIDADEINRQRLVTLANEFSSKGMTLDLKESNFDGKYPIMAAPIFPDPTSFYLRELSERFILPSVDELKMNSISCFQTNPVFEEAFLAGMNTEMGRELIWREYPTDERGSYFRKFWDQDELPEDFSKGYFDVKYMHNWKGRLGQNHEPGKGRMIVFVIKSELMMMYPQTSICLARAKTSSNERYLEKILSPAMTGWLSNDTFMAGFYPDQLETTSGVYLTFVETDKSQRFSNEYKGSANDSLSSQFAVNRSDNGSVWGVEVHPSYLQL